MTTAPPDGTRYALPDVHTLRLDIAEKLRRLYDGWGYHSIDVPVLEHYDPNHPRAESSFKLSDRDSHVLALRSDFTPSVSRLVKLHYPHEQNPTPKRFQYCGKLWQAIDPDFARTREFTQLGVELVGVSNARADAELVHLARESVRAVGVEPRVEIGNPGFVRSLFDLADIPESVQDDLADAIDRKDMRSLHAQLRSLDLPAELERTLLAVPDLYGDLSSIDEAKRLAPWPDTLAATERLEAVVAEFEDPSDLLIDFGMARRLRYYTGIIFRAYTFDFGQPLIGGGRYDGDLLPYAAGFALGLERLVAALPPIKPNVPPLVLSLYDEAARRLRAHGVVVERALEGDVDSVRRYARARGIPYLLTEEGLEPLVADLPVDARLQGVLATLDIAPLDAAPLDAATRETDVTRG